MASLPRRNGRIKSLTQGGRIGGVRTRTLGIVVPDNILKNFAAWDITPLLELGDIEIDGPESETGQSRRFAISLTSGFAR